MRGFNPGLSPWGSGFVGREETRSRYEICVERQARSKFGVNEIRPGCKNLLDNRAADLV